MNGRDADRAIVSRLDCSRMGVERSRTKWNRCYNNDKNILLFFYYYFIIFFMLANKI